MKRRTLLLGAAMLAAAPAPGGAASEVAAVAGRGVRGRLGQRELLLGSGPWMRELGVDLVAINIFGWAQLQPQPGPFDFSRLDRILEAAESIDAALRDQLGHVIATLHKLAR